jgi:hypothetical protein
VTSICASKIATYNLLRGIVPIPDVYQDINYISKFPIFIKPDRGYGSKDTLLATSVNGASEYLANYPKDSMLLLEYLPGKETTVDCFTDRHGNLCFNGSRDRGRINNGISVNTKQSSEYQTEFAKWANLINDALHPRGAWFFQAKLDANGRPKLLEVAARLAGSSGLYRCLGVNFALLSCFDAFDIDIAVSMNSYTLEMDRALSNRFKIELEYDHVFVDLDDCLIVNKKLNLQLVKFLYKAASIDKKIILITRHYRDPMITLKEYRLCELFDEVIHISDRGKSKSEFIHDCEGIFIDDSYAERCDVAKEHRFPVFSPDMIEALL